MKKTGLFLLLGCMLALSGCGNEEAKTNYQSGIEALEAAEYDNAITDFDAVIASGDKLSEGYRGLGIAHIYQGDYPDAAVAFERSLNELTEDDPVFKKDVQMYLAFCRSRQGETDKAIALYSEVLKTEEDPECYFLRGKAYLGQSNFDGAKADFDKAAKLSDDYNLFINICQAYETLRMNADGAAYLEKALELASEDENNYYNRGLIYYYLQDYTKAKEQLIAALNEGNDGNAILLLGRVYLDMEDVANARAMYQEHVKDESTAPQAYNGLALCDIAEGNYDSALQNIQKGLEYGNPNAQQSLLYNEIVVYEYQYDWTNAKSVAAQYVVQYPTDEAGSRENEFLMTR
ncbi:MAG: tetratricopeptide repeat protein [Lachnospiraceae bacterium]|nr:tetratricopeptide repeat protein [Lachnospiraceae bacterium]